MTRADEWSRVDYRSRAAAAICAITTTLVAAVTVTAYVGTRIGFASSCRWSRRSSGSRPRVVAPYGVGGSDYSLLRVSSILDYLC